MKQKLDYIYKPWKDVETRWMSQSELSPALLELLYSFPLVLPPLLSYHLVLYQCSRGLLLYNKQTVEQKQTLLTKIPVINPNVIQLVS